MRQTQSDHEVVYKVAIVYALAGKIDHALDKLEEAVRLGFPLVFVRADTDLRALRSHPRFKALIAQKDQ